MRRSLIVLAVAGVLAVCVVPMAAAVGGCSGGVNGATVVNDLSPAGACILSALESGQINFTNPTQAVLQIAAICVGSTAESIFAVLTQLLSHTPDAGLGGPPAAWYSQVALVANAASKLHGTYADMVAAGVGK
jgi:hypothetical protein